MRPTRAFGLTAATVAAALLAGCGGQAAGDAGAGYPRDDIKLIIPNAPGGPNDTSARIVGTCLEKETGQTVVPENVEGASQAIGVRKLISAKPDGYTIEVVPHTGLTLTPLLDDVGFGIDDVRPIAAVFETAMVLVTSADSPYKSGRAFFDAATKSPGKISVGTPGPTSPKQLVIQALESQHNVKLNPVPLEGQSGQVSGILGKNVDAVAVEATNDIKALVEAKKVIPLAALGAEPVNWLPDTPTLADLGYGKAALPNNVYMAVGPKDLPDEVVKVLEPKFEKCMKSDEVVKKVGELYVPVPFAGSASSRKQLEDAAATYKRLVG